MRMKYYMDSQGLTKMSKFQQILFRYRYFGAMMVVLLLVVSATIVAYKDCLFFSDECQPVSPELASTSATATTPHAISHSTPRSTLSSTTVSAPATASNPNFSTPSTLASITTFTPTSTISNLSISNSSISLAFRASNNEDIDKCNNDSECKINQVCEKILNSKQCVCKPGYAKVGENCNLVCESQNETRIATGECGCLPGVNRGLSCEADDDRDFLMVVQDIGALRIEAPSTNSKSSKYLNAQNYNRTTVPIDIDCVGMKVYSSKIKENSEITRMSYDGSHAETFLSDVGIPEDISIDWVSQILFWIDSEDKKIEAANLINMLRVNIVVDDLIDPKNIVVHPKREKIFWSDWNNGSAKIEWANEDGTEREIFFEHEEYLINPHSLVIDWSTDELCWVEAGIEKIVCVRMKDKVIREIVEGVSYPYDLAMSTNHHYWTDWKSKTIVAMEKNECRIAVEIPPESCEKLYGIVAAPKICPEFSNACQSDNGGCEKDSELCVPNGHGNRTCM